MKKNSYAPPVSVEVELQLDCAVMQSSLTSFPDLPDGGEIF